jgi:glycosyltransferase involved in cell wall biosynthesis
VDGQTGTIVDIGDVAGLAAAITRYLEDDELRLSHGASGWRRAREEFQPERIWEGLLEEYRELLSRNR